MKKRYGHKDTQKVWEPMVWALCWRKCSTLEISYVYYVESNRGGGYCKHMNKEARLLHTDKQGVRVYGAQLS